MQPNLKIVNGDNSEIRKIDRVFRFYGSFVMSEIIRHEINEECAYSGIVEAGDFVFLSFCGGNIGQSVEA